MAKKTENEVLTADEIKAEDTEETAADETAATEGSETDADSEGEDTEESGEEAVDDAEKLLIARIPILYLARQYKVGDILPANNEEMVEAWLEAGSAVWMAVPEKAPKAKPATAEPGLPGMASASETGEDLVGKAPKTNTRKK